VKSVRRRLSRDNENPYHGHSMEQAASLEKLVTDWLSELPPQFKLALEPGSQPESAPSVLIAQRCELAIAANRLILKIYLPFIKAASASSNPVHQASFGTINAAHAIVNASKALYTVWKTRTKEGLENASLTPALFEFYSFGRSLFNAGVVCAHAVIHQASAVWAKAALEATEAALDILKDPLVDGPASESVRVVEIMRGRAEIERRGATTGAGMKRKYDQVDKKTEVVGPGFALPYVGPAVVSGEDTSPPPATSQEEHESQQRGQSSPQRTVAGADSSPTKSMTVTTVTKPIPPLHVTIQSTAGTSAPNKGNAVKHGKTGGVTVRSRLGAPHVHNPRAASGLTLLRDDEAGMPGSSSVPSSHYPPPLSASSEASYSQSLSLSQPLSQSQSSRDVAELHIRERSSSFHQDARMSSLDYTLPFDSTGRMSVVDLQGRQFGVSDDNGGNSFAGSSPSEVYDALGRSYNSPYRSATDPSSYALPPSPYASTSGPHVNGMQMAAESSAYAPGDRRVSSSSPSYGGPTLTVQQPQQQPQQTSPMAYGSMPTSSSPHEYYPRPVEYEGSGYESSAGSLPPQTMFNTDLRTASPHAPIDSSLSGMLAQRPRDVQRSMYDVEENGRNFEALYCTPQSQLQQEMAQPPPHVSMSWAGGSADYWNGEYRY
jgi:hypothetical protein